MERLHISVFGPRNAGKSSLINALTGQEVSIVSNVAGTTTDPVAKPMELHPLGAVMITDTAGYDDDGALGLMRVSRTKKILQKTDIAIFVIPSNISPESLIEAAKWWQMISSICKKSILIINSFAISSDEQYLHLPKSFGEAKPLIVDALNNIGIDGLLEQLSKLNKEEASALSVLGHLVKEEDVVMLVMPQDMQAPKGRLILPQVQTIRDLLDNKCVVISCTANNFVRALDTLKSSPNLIVTDSQVFPFVYENKPNEAPLTSFSVLMARMKGDISNFVEGAKAIAQLNADSRVLIAEACTHAPLAEDIGREQIPAMLRKRFGNEIQIDMVAGNDWPENIQEYDLIIHCGACMFNSAHVKSRQKHARDINVPMTNYGVFIAAFNNILDKIIY